MRGGGLGRPLSPVVLSSPLHVVCGPQDTDERRDILFTQSPTDGVTSSTTRLTAQTHEVPAPVYGEAEGGNTGATVKLWSKETQLEQDWGRSCSSKAQTIQTGPPGSPRPPGVPRHRALPSLTTSILLGKLRKAQLQQPFLHLSRQRNPNDYNSLSRLHESGPQADGERAGRLPCANTQETCLGRAWSLGPAAASQRSTTRADWCVCGSE